MIFKGRQKLVGETHTADEIKKIIYPVGSVILSFTPRDLNNEMVGTRWVLISDGYFLEATTDENKLEETTEAGLPDVTGYFTITGGGASKFWGGASGCFNERNKGSARFFQSSSGSDSGLSSGFDLKASNSNAIYGKSQTVQPKSMKIFIYKRIE